MQRKPIKVTEYHFVGVARTPLHPYKRYKLFLTSLYCCIFPVLFPIRYRQIQANDHFTFKQTKQYVPNHEFQPLKRTIVPSLIYRRLWRGRGRALYAFTLYIFAKCSPRKKKCHPNTPYWRSNSKILQDTKRISRTVKKGKRLVYLR